MSYWFSNHDNLVCLATWLYETNILTNIAETLAFFEKPWHYEEQWARYQEYLEE